MRYFLPLLLAAFATATPAQQPPDSGAAHAQHESLAMAARTRSLQKASDDRRAVDYAENRQRCEAAMRIAEQCGKAATFSCGEHGFKAAAPDAVVRHVARDEMSRDQRYRCATTAARGAGS